MLLCSLGASDVFTAQPLDILTLSWPLADGKYLGENFWDAPTVSICWVVYCPAVGGKCKMQRQLLLAKHSCLLCLVAMTRSRQLLGNLWLYQTWKWRIVQLEVIYGAHFANFQLRFLHGLGNIPKSIGESF